MRRRRPSKDDYRYDAALDCVGDLLGFAGGSVEKMLAGVAKGFGAAAAAELAARIQEEALILQGGPLVSAVVAAQVQRGVQERRAIGEGGRSASNVYNARSRRRHKLQRSKG